MKTKADGYFYVPNMAIDFLKIEKLFNDILVGDQTGGISPYPDISDYPDTYVEMMDFFVVNAAFGSQEGSAKWNYMADVNSDGYIELMDSLAISQHYGNHGTYLANLSNVTATFNTGTVSSPDSNGFITVPQNATSFTVKRYGSPIGAMIIFYGSHEPPIAYSTLFEFATPSDGDSEVWYYVLAKIYVPQELSGTRFYLYPDLVDDWIRNVKINNRLKYSGGHPPCQPPASVDLGLLAKGYHLLELEFGEKWSSGKLRFHLATTSGQYARLARFRVYVPDYGDTEYEYNVVTSAWTTMKDDYFLIGYADDFIDNICVDGLVWQNWMWNVGAYGSIYAWGDGFCYPLGNLENNTGLNAYTLSFAFGEIWHGGLLDFQYISRTMQSNRIGLPKFYALAKIDNIGADITLNNAMIYGGSQWAGNPGVSGRNVTTLATYNVTYDEGGNGGRFNTLLDIEVGNWWATWELGGSQPPDVAIPLNFTAANFTSNLWFGRVLSTYYYWDISLRDYTIDIYSFQNLPIKGIEEAGTGQSNGIINPGYTVGLDFFGTTMMVASAWMGPYAPVGAIVGVGCSGVAAALEYAQGQQVSRYTDTIKENNHWQLTANQAMILGLVTNSSTESKSDLVFMKFQPNAGYQCGLTKVVLNGDLVATRCIVPDEGWPSYDDVPIGSIEITLCIPWFICSQT